MMQDKEVTVSPISIFLPHVFADISKEDVFRVFEDTLQFGQIHKIECIPKVNLKDGHSYYSCYIFFLNWKTNDNTDYILPRILSGEATRVYYKSDKYWVVCHNQSDIAFYKNPVHTDLVVHDITFDFEEENLKALLEVLDLGKVDSFKFVDEIVSGAMVRNAYIHFEFWYRTQTSYAFQQVIKEKRAIIIPIDDKKSLSFSYEKPKFEGINPNVWNRNKDLMNTLPLLLPIINY